MRIFPAFAIAAFVAASPCLAQESMDGHHDAAPHDERADQPYHAPQRDEHNARDSGIGDHRAPVRAHVQAQHHVVVVQHPEHHAVVVQHPEHRTDEDGRDGGHADMGH
jgi:hypothetical protein